MQCNIALLCCNKKRGVTCNDMSTTCSTILGHYSNRNNSAVYYNEALLISPYIFHHVMKITYYCTYNFLLKSWVQIWGHIPFCIIIILLVLWHNCWKPEYWNEQMQPLLGNGAVNTFPQQQTIEQQYTMWSMLKLCNEDQLGKPMSQRSVGGHSRQLLAAAT